MAMVTIVPALCLAFISISEIPPAAHIYAGDVAIDNKSWNIAIKHFTAAINSKRLPKPAMAMSYWNLHLAYEALNDIDNAAESLLGFIVYSQDYIGTLEQIRKSKRRGNPGFKWLRRNKIKKRLTHASFKIQQYWNKSRNETQPIYKRGNK